MPGAGPAACAVDLLGARPHGTAGGGAPPVPGLPGAAPRAGRPAQRRPRLQRLLHAGHGAAWSMWPRVAALAMASIVGVVIGLSGVADKYSTTQDSDTTTSVFDSAPSGGWDL